jgi:murein DD-endopeptidase MepM/ murein hydrolase activator NlpD
MDSTGNSTGTHTHYEVWLVVNGVWQNIDPLKPTYNIRFVETVAEVNPLGGEETPPVPEFEIPEVDFVLCKNVQPFRINLREKPFVSANVRILSMIEPSQIWEFCGHKVDTLGNVWFALRKGDRVGWAAAYYQGEAWILPQATS